MKLWIDDIRKMPSWYDVWAKDASEAIAVLSTKKVTHLSLDHDLADKMDGITIANWIEEVVLTDSGMLDFVPEIQLHTANAVGRANMQRALQKVCYCYTTDPFTILKMKRDHFGNGEVNFEFEDERIKS